MPAEKEKVSADSSLQNEPQAVVIRREPEKELLSWKAPARPFKRRDRQFFVTAFAISRIIALILFFAEGLMPVLLIIALVFLIYVLSTVEPEEIEYKITNKGIKISGSQTEWGVVDRFWFGKRYDSDLLIFEMTVLPGRLELVIDPELRERLKKEISVFALYEEAPPSSADRMMDWVGKRIPGGK